MNICNKTIANLVDVCVCFNDQDAFYIERLDRYMGHGFGMADNLFAAHYGDSFVYGVDMLGPNPGEALEPTPEGAKVVQVGNGQPESYYIVLVHGEKCETMSEKRKAAWGF